MRVTKIVVTAAGAALFLTAANLAEAQQRAPTPGTSDRQTQSQPTVGTGSATGTMKLDRSTLHEVKEDDAMAKSLNINAGDLRAMAIYGSDGKKIGDVKNVLADSSNEIKAVSSDVGGFLGIGAREVVFPVDKLQKGSEEQRLQTAMTKDEIENLEAWSNTGTTTGRGAMPDAAPSRTTPSTPPAGGR